MYLIYLQVKSGIGMSTKRINNAEKNKLKVKKILKLTREGKTVQEACNAVKISKPTYYHWKRWVETLEDEKLNFVDLYAVRLQRELRNCVNMAIALKDSKKIIKNIFNKVGKEDGQSLYIPLTSHKGNQ